MDLRPCACGEIRFARRRAITEENGEPIVTYTGPCATCGTEREFAFRHPDKPEEPPPGDGARWFGAPTPSQLLDAGEWLHVADTAAAAVPSTDSAPTPDVADELATAMGAIDEVLNCVPAGADAVPASAFHTERGKSIYAADPARFEVARLRGSRTTYKDLLVQLRLPDKTVLSPDEVRGVFSRLYKAWGYLGSTAVNDALRVLGWSEQPPEGQPDGIPAGAASDPNVILAATGLPTRIGMIRLSNGTISRISANATDPVPADSVPADAFLDDAFTLACRAAARDLGRPDEKLPGPVKQERWRRENVWLAVRKAGTTVELTMEPAQPAVPSTPDASAAPGTPVATGTPAAAGHASPAGPTGSGPSGAPGAAQPGPAAGLPTAAPAASPLAGQTGQTGLPGPSTGGDLSPEGGPSWEDFRRRLAAALAGLEVDQFLVISKEVAPLHYVQAIRFTEMLHAEAASNQFLEGHLRLTNDEERTLAAAGWHPPSGDAFENWWARVPRGARDSDYEQLATMMVTALREVYHVGAPSELVYRSYQNGPNAGARELSALGISRETGMAQGAAATRDAPATPPSDGPAPGATPSALPETPQAPRTPSVPQTPQSPAAPQSPAPHGPQSSPAPQGPQTSPGPETPQAPPVPPLPPRPRTPAISTATPQPPAPPRPPTPPVPQAGGPSSSGTDGYTGDDGGVPHNPSAPPPPPQRPPDLARPYTSNPNLHLEVSTKGRRHKRPEQPPADTPAHLTGDAASRTGHVPRHQAPPVPPSPSAPPSASAPPSTPAPTDPAPVGPQGPEPGRGDGSGWSRQAPGTDPEPYSFGSPDPAASPGRPAPTRPGGGADLPYRPGEQEPYGQRPSAGPGLGPDTGHTGGTGWSPATPSTSSTSAADPKPYSFGPTAPVTPPQGPGATGGPFGADAGPTAGPGAAAPELPTFGSPPRPLDTPGRSDTMAGAGRPGEAGYPGPVGPADRRTADGPGASAAADPSRGSLLGGLPQAVTNRPDLNGAIMQKVLAHDHVAAYLERGYDMVSGFVHRLADISHLRTPEQLMRSLGLAYQGTPFSDQDEAVHVIRWRARIPSLYRTPLGGTTEETMRSVPGGWVVEAPPFSGTGYAPTFSEVIPEFKVDSHRLPHMAEMYRVDRGGSEVKVAVYNADEQRWAPVEQ